MIGILEGFAERYRGALVARFLWRLGVAPHGAHEDLALVASAEAMMVATKMPIDDFFFAYAAGRGRTGEVERTDFEELLSGYGPTRDLDAPYWSGDAPQSMLIDEVEAIWSAIAERDDWQPLTDKIAAVRELGKAMGKAIPARPTV